MDTLSRCQDCTAPISNGANRCRACLLAWLYGQKPQCCRHCGTAPIRHRGLCAPCYRTPTIRVLYPVLFPRMLPKRPLDVVPERTDAMQGSEAKIAELERRAKAQLDLFRDDDGTDEDVPLPDLPHYSNHSGRHCDMRGLHWWG